MMQGAVSKGSQSYGASELNSFLGFKLDKGYHKIKIVYHSPLFREGSIISIIGLILLFIEIFIDLKKKRT